jgi:hypothetical protein
VSKVELGKAQKNVYIAVPAPAPAPVAASAPMMREAPTHSYMAEAQASQAFDNSEVSAVPLARAPTAPSSSSRVNSSAPMTKSGLPHNGSRRTSVAPPPNTATFGQSVRQAPAGPPPLTQHAIPTTVPTVVDEDLKATTAALSSISIDKENLSLSAANENEQPIYTNSLNKPSSRQSVCPSNNNVGTPMTKSSSQPAISKRTSLAPNTATQAMRLTTNTAVPTQPVQVQSHQPQFAQAPLTPCVIPFTPAVSVSTPALDKDVSETSKVLSLSHGAGTSAAVLLQQFRAKRALLQQQQTLGPAPDFTSTSANTVDALSSSGDSASIKRLRTAAPAVPVPAMSAAMSAARSWR